MRILGIDLGSSGIKAVEMDSAFGRYDIHDYHERTLSRESNPEEAIAELIGSLSKPPDRIIVAIQSGQTTFRRIQVPTRDKKAIQASVTFELEDELPFPVDELVHDYVILSQNKQGSVVHVAASLKQYLTAALDSWKKAKVDPDVITTEAWAYRIFLNHLIGQTGQETPVLLVQIGQERTTIYLHWQGGPSLVREMPWGGNDLTRAMSQKFEIPFEQAEVVKLDRGILAQVNADAADLTPEQLDISSCLANTMSGLIFELKQAELMTKKATYNTISTIYLSGGTSLLPGLGPWIEEMVGIPTKSILALSSATTSGVTYSEQTDAKFFLAAALALALVGPDRANCVNFRKGNFAKQSSKRQFDVQVLKKPLLAVGIVLFCLCLSLTVQSAVYKSRLATTNALLEKSVRSFFGQISSSALKTYMSNTSTLRTSINKEIAKEREISKLFGPNSTSPLDFLNTVSTTIPKNVIVDLTQFQAGISPNDSFVSGTSVPSTSMTFSLNDAQTSEKLALLLGSKITSLQRGKLEEVNLPETSGKQWKITFSGKPTEDSYGN